MEKLSAVVVAGLLSLVATSAAADEFQDFANAKNAYETGEYETAVTRFEELRASQPKNKGLVEELHKLLAVSYLFLGNKTKAEENFLELLSVDPEFALDPLVFPIDVIDFFAEVKGRHAERLSALTAARAAEERAKEEAEAEKRRIETERLKRNVYLGREIERRSLLVAVLPFGAGQFQNGHKIKGGLLLGGELLLTASAITTFILHEHLRGDAADPIASRSERQTYEHLEAGYRIANTASVVALGAVMIAGIVDSLFYYQNEIVTWNRLEERDVPKELRPKPVAVVVTPFPTPGGAGLAAVARF
jgi:tetratricopeptide (TPR) repeat protein